MVISELLYLHFHLHANQECNTGVVTSPKCQNRGWSRKAGRQVIRKAIGPLTVVPWFAVHNLYHSFDC